LPLSIVGELVRLRGFDVVELGADLTTAAFVAAVVHVPRLVAVGIGITSIEHLDAARVTVEAIRRVRDDVPIILGGQAVLSPEIARLLGASGWAASGRDAATLVDRLAPA
jgi:methanogenic corrinoid protein MtbC1